MTKLSNSEHRWCIKLRQCLVAEVGIGNLFNYRKENYEFDEEATILYRSNTISHEFFFTDIISVTF